jgi:DNA-binding PadR family transcriptional regulator
MMSINRASARSFGLPLAADDIIEFHAARLLLLLDICGTAGRIDGLTKMAKLDFFARYPDFFDAAIGKTEGLSRKEAVESAMVRHHYGPWDKRYYHVLSHLEAKQLISVTKHGNSYRLTLTPGGKERARKLRDMPAFDSLTDRMKEIKKQFGSRTGSSLKDMIYRTFDAEVGKRRMGEMITND